MRYLGALIAGVLAVFAFSPFNWYPLSIVCPALLFLLWLKAPIRRCFWLGFVYGVGMFGAGVSWVYVSLHQFGNMPAPLAGIVVTIFVFCLALFPAAVGGLQAAWPGTNVLVRVALVIPGLWAASEWLRGWFLTGFPWLSLGYSQIGWPLGGFASVVGVYGVSWFTAVTGGVLVAAVVNRFRLAPMGIAVAITLMVAGWLTERINWVEPKGKPVKVALVQGNIPLAEKWHMDQRSAIIKRYLDLSDDTNAELIVWPESALPLYADQLPESFWRRLEDHPADFVFGILERRRDAAGDKLYNSVVAVGSSSSFYRKHHLVPFGEFLPLSSMLGWLLDYLHIPMSDFSSWSGAQAPLMAAGNPLGISICYEDAFPEDVRMMLPDATLLVNVSEDAWFGDSLGPHQRLQMAQMRAVEMGRPMVRAGNTGVSAVIDHRGRISARSPQFTQIVIQDTVQPMTGTTPYVRFGNLIMIVLIVLGLGVSMLRDLRHKARIK
jgi:apolipoprotein N-acyltransferase